MKVAARIVGVVVAVVASGRATGSASAAPEERGARIVVEAYDGPRPDDAAPVLDRMYEALAQRGFEAPRVLADDVDRRVSRDGGALTAGQVVDAQKAVDDAYQHYIDGDYPVAIAKADQALSLYASAPGQLAHEPALRALRWKALLIAARSSEVIEKGDEAFALMAEAIRSFPDRTVSGSEFDPRVGALHRRVKEELARQGAGSLEVHVDDPAAVIFIDEQFVGTGTAKLARALPGRYRVYVAKSDLPGRVRDVEVGAGAAISSTVSWRLDGALRTGGGRVALAIGKGDAPEAATAAATLLGRALGARQVVVLSTRPIEGRRALIGYSIAIESQTKVFGAVQIEPVAPGRDTIQRLTALLAGDKDIAPTGLITKEPVWAPARPLRTPPMSRQRKASLVIGGVALASGVVALGFELSSRSTYQESQHEVDNARQDALFESANHKYKLAQGFAIGAAACAIGALTVWLTGDASDERPSLGFAPSGDGGSFFVTGRF